MDCETGSGSIRRFWDIRQRKLYAVHHAGIHQKAGCMWKKDWTLTVSCILPAVSSSRAMTTPMYVSMSSRTIVYKGMFLVGQLRTFFCGSSEIRIMSLPLHWYIPVSVPTPIQAGREPIRTVLSYTTVRSTPSAETQTRCWQERRTMESPYLGRRDAQDSSGCQPKRF